MNNLSTSSGEEESNCLITSGARQGNPTVQCSIAMATQFTASEHLNDPGHLSEECLQPHCCGTVFGTIILEEIYVIQA